MKFEDIKDLMKKPEPKADTYEAGMAQNQLLKIGTHAIKIHNMLDNDAEMESWVAKKIDLASNYVKSVHGYTAGSKAGTYDDDGMSEGTDTTATDKEIKMAKGIAFDKRNKDNMSKATSTIEKVRKGLSQQPDVADALRTANEDAGTMDWSTDKVKEFGDALIQLAKGQVPSDDLQIDDLEDGWAGADQDSRDQMAETIGARLMNVLVGYLQFSAGQKPSTDDVKDAQGVVNDPEFKKAYHSNESAVQEDAGEDEKVVDMLRNIKQHLDNHPNMSEHPSLVALDQLADDLESGDKPADYESVKEDDGDERAIAAMKLARDEGGKEGFDYPQGGKYGYKAERGSGTGAMGTMQVNVTIHNRDTDETMHIKDMNYLELEKGDEQETLAMIWDENKDLIQKESAVKEDAGEGHMSKSQLYATAKMAIELIDMIKKGDDLEGWVQTKLNLAADYLQAVYHYEDYQKLNPYREDLDGALMQKHAGVIQKNLDEILARETKTADVDTKPGMMRILKKRVNEVEKDIAKENRKNTDEGGMPASVIKSKQRYANMSDEELADRFKGADEKTLRQMAWRHGYGNMSSHYLDRVKNVMTGKKTATTEAELEEGVKEWAKNLAAAGVIVAGLAGFNSINNAIDNSVPAIQAMNSALEMAVDQNDDKLAQLIKKDLSDAKLRLDTGKDLSYVKGLQDKYIKFMPTEGLAYESKLAVQLKQQLK